MLSMDFHAFKLEPIEYSNSGLVACLSSTSTWLLPKNPKWNIQEDTFTNQTLYGVKNFTNIVTTKDPFKTGRATLFGWPIGCVKQNDHADDPSLRDALSPSQIKSPMGQGQFGPHRLQSPLLILFSSYAFAPFREMSSLFAQSTIVPLTEELNSELFWFGGTIGAGLCEETFRSFGDAAMTFDGLPAFSAGRLPSFKDDYLSPPPPQSTNRTRQRTPSCSHPIQSRSPSHSHTVQLYFSITRFKRSPLPIH